ncbi:MAG: cytochrome b N-terminal domain-containing protein [Acidimicrobiales bacterium]
MRPEVLSAVVNLNHPDHYFHWEFMLISLANLLVVVVMLALFVAAIALPFLRSKDLPNPASHGQGHPESTDPPSALPPGERTWTGGLRRLGLHYLPPSKLLPDTQPAYVASWVYVFGVATIAGLVVVIATGLVLAIEGPAWWHTSFVGHFVNSLHLWSVELFMGFMAIHLWAKYWMAAWRGRRQLTWMTGVAAFLIAVFEAFTGYLSQTNFDSQWIAFESKDAFNAGGVGAIVNPMNFGQALMLHISLVPLVLVAVVGLHVLLVRVRGVVPPIDAHPRDLGIGDSVASENLPAGTASGAGPLSQDVAR